MALPAPGKPTAAPPKIDTYSRQQQWGPEVPDPAYPAGLEASGYEHLETWGHPRRTALMLYRATDAEKPYQGYAVLQLGGAVAHRIGLRELRSFADLARLYLPLVDVALHTYDRMDEHEDAPAPTHQHAPLPPTRPAKSGSAKE